MTRVEQTSMIYRRRGNQLWTTKGLQHHAHCNVDDEEHVRQAPGELSVSLEIVELVAPLRRDSGGENVSSASWKGQQA